MFWFIFTFCCNSQDLTFVLSNHVLSPINTDMKELDALRFPFPQTAFKSGLTCLYLWFSGSPLWDGVMDQTLLVLMQNMYCLLNTFCSSWRGCKGLCCVDTIASLMRQQNHTICKKQKLLNSHWK